MIKQLKKQTKLRRSNNYSSKPSKQVDQTVTEAIQTKLWGLIIIEASLTKDGDQAITEAITKEGEPTKQGDQNIIEANLTEQGDLTVYRSKPN